jgi:hypothetical protein
MDRSHLIADGAAGAATLAIPSLAAAQPRIRWRGTTRPSRAAPDTAAMTARARGSGAARDLMA